MVEYLGYKARIVAVVKRIYYGKYFFLDGPVADRLAVLGKVPYRSQHCQIYAVFASAVEGEAARDLLCRMNANSVMPKSPCAPPFYLFRAFEKWAAPRKFAPCGMRMILWLHKSWAHNPRCH